MQTDVVRRARAAAAATHATSRASPTASRVPTPPATTSVSWRRRRVGKRAGAQGEPVAQRHLPGLAGSDELYAVAGLGGESRRGVEDLDGPQDVERLRSVDGQDQDMAWRRHGTHPLADASRPLGPVPHLSGHGHVVVLRVLLGPQQHDREHPRQHRDVFDDQRVPTSLIRPTPCRAMTASVGTIIDALISFVGRQPWPRRRIQAAIGTVIVAAIRSNIAAGASSCRSAQLEPTDSSAQPAGSQSTAMPRNMTTTISR